MTRDNRPSKDTEAEPFLARWSRRKLANENPAADASADASAVTDASTESSLDNKYVESAPPDDTAPDSASATPAPSPLCDDDMPPLESIDAGGDIEAFFSPRVSSSLRRAALKRLFAQPDFNVTDGLDDYCEDYRHFTPLGDIITADMRHHMERARQKLAAALDDDNAPARSDGDESNDTDAAGTTSAQRADTGGHAERETARQVDGPVTEGPEDMTGEATRHNQQKRAIPTDPTAQEGDDDAPERS